MSVAINRPELNEILFLGLANSDQAMPAGVTFSTDADRAFMSGFDLDVANSLLDEIGMTARDADGFRMSCAMQRLPLQLPGPVLMNITHWVHR